MAPAKAKRKVKARVKTARKAVAAAKTKVRKAAKKAARRRRTSTRSLAKEFGALADKITDFGKEVIAQGTERAGKIARTSLNAIEHGAEKIGNEVGAIRRAALSRVKR